MEIQEKIQQARRYGRLLQCLIIILANHRCGVKIDSDFRPRLIYKYEGGGVINGKEIVITFDRFENKIYCYDDFSRKSRKEAIITEEVTKELLEKISWESQEEDGVILQSQVEKLILDEIGLPTDDLHKIILSFCNNPFGDHLNALFQD